MTERKMLSDVGSSGSTAVNSGAVASTSLMCRTNAAFSAGLQACSELLEWMDEYAEGIIIVLPVLPSLPRFPATISCTRDAVDDERDATAGADCDAKDADGAFFTGDVASAGGSGGGGGSSG